MKYILATIIFLSLGNVAYAEEGLLGIISSFCKTEHDMREVIKRGFPYPVPKDLQCITNQGYLPAETIENLKPEGDYIIQKVRTNNGVVFTFIKASEV